MQNCSNLKDARMHTNLIFNLGAGLLALLPFILMVIALEWAPQITLSRWADKLIKYMNIRLISSLSFSLILRSGILESTSCFNTTPVSVTVCDILYVQYLRTYLFYHSNTQLMVQLSTRWPFTPLGTISSPGPVTTHSKWVRIIIILLLIMMMKTTWIPILYMEVWLLNFFVTDIWTDWGASLLHSPRP